MKNKTLPKKTMALLAIGFFLIFTLPTILMPLSAFADSTPTITAFSPHSVLGQQEPPYLNSVPGVTPITSAPPGTAVWVFGTGFSTDYIGNTLRFATESGSPVGYFKLPGISGLSWLCSCARFAVPNYPVGTYRVTVDNSQYGVGVDYKTFTITAPGTEQALAILAPNGGETLTLGSQYTIRWTAYNLSTANPGYPNFYITLLNEDGAVVQGYIAGYIAKDLGSSVASYTWTVGNVYSDSGLTQPLTVPLGRYRVLVKDGLGHNPISGGYFTIVAPPTQPPGGGGGGGLNLPNVVLNSKPVNNEQDLSEPPILATLTSAPYFVYLSQVPYTGFGDSAKLILFLILVAFWSGVVVYIVKFVDIKKIIRRAFRNVENEPQFAEANMSSGFVYDINNNRVLTMDMNPINNNDSHTDVFVPKYGVEHSQNNKAVEASEVNTKTARDYGIDNGGNVVSNSHSNGDTIFGESAVSNGNGNGSVKQNDKFDLTTDVNSFVNLIVRGDEKPVLEYVKKIKDKGISVDEFVTNVVLELDIAYRAKLEGETNRRNIVLSQIVSHWNNSKMETVMSTLLGIAENNYADKNLGAKIAVMRIMRS